MDNNKFGFGSEVPKHAPDKLVEILADRIVLDKCDFEKCKKTVKVNRKVHCIKDCKLKVCDIDIYDSKNKEAWVILIEFELIINYETKHGSCRTISETILYEKEVPKPPQCKDPKEKHEFIKLIPKVFVPFAECKDVDFDNVDYFTLITAKIVFEVKVLVIAKQKLLIKAFFPHCLEKE